ncbi:PQQ-dependent sugar dehydrogenase [Neptunomonas japonica]|uniref:PQQ-dependent sugar dehydrogenase n=1 Tax=Neptunomonas japonica TaxID=417574 RepID=UPI000426D589|nr:PQQ-dependent sugar dehydrogenase [Neptunomonas japonica]
MKQLKLLLLASAVMLLASPVNALLLQPQTINVNGNYYKVNVPQGYILEVLTTDVDRPRMLTFHPDGSLFAGSRSGNVYQLTQPYGTVETLKSRFRYPHSVAFRGEQIYIASEEGLYQGRYTSADYLRIHGLQKVMELPVGGHSSRTVKIGPDQRIYMSLGISGNCSNEYLGPGYSMQNKRGGVVVLNESGIPMWETYSSGLRNPVGFDWSPYDRELYASNNGPDHWGFEQPPEQFVHLTKGSFHGMPWYQYDGDQIKRDNCISRTPPRALNEVKIPVAMFPARNAPMAVAFVPMSDGVSELQNEFSGNALVALHGSWATQYAGDKASRRPPKLVMVRFNKGKPSGVEDVLTGFQLSDGSRWARPAGVAAGPDGAIYMSSDGVPSAIFRLRRM